MRPTPVDSREPDELPPQLEAQVVLTLVLAAIPLIAIVAFFLAAYPAFIKLSPNGLAKLAIPWRLSKAMEFTLYALSFGVLLPAGILTAARQARAFERRRIDPALPALANLAIVAAVLTVARITLSAAPTIGDPARQYWVRPLSIGALAAIVALAAANVLVVRRPPALLSANVLGDHAIPALVAGCLISSFVFLPLSVFSAARGLAALAIAAICYALWRRLAGVSVPRSVGIATDALAVLLTFALVWNVRWTPPGLPTLKLAHEHDVYLGPINSVLHGGAVLVDVFPQYGAGPTYLFAGIFSLIPIGYGPFELATEVLDTIFFLVLYGILRLGTTRLLSLAGIVLVTLTAAVTFGRIATFAYPNRPLRLLLPVLAVLLIQLAERYPRRRAVFEWTLAALLGTSSIWAAEVFFYTAAGVLAALACQARLEAPEGRGMSVDRRALVRLGGAVVAAQVIFAAATRLFAGAWPDWGDYLEYLHRYASGAGTFPLAPFGVVVLLGVSYFVAVAATATVLIWNRPFALRHRRELIGICALEGVAVAFFSYIAGQSYAVNLHKMAPVTVVLAILLLGLMGTSRARSTSAVRAGFVVFAVGCAAAALLSDHAVLKKRLGQSPIVAPSAALSDIRYAAGYPVIDPRAPQAVRFLRETIGGRDKVLVLLDDYALTTEVLLRAHKAELLPMSDPYAESFLPTHVAYLKRLASQLPVGTRFLSRVDLYRMSKPGFLDKPNEVNIQLMQELRSRFVIKTAVVGPGGLRIYRLAARR